MVITFYLFALIAVVGGLTLLVVRSPVYCALSLVGTFFCLAGIFILLGQEFVAAIQILIYAGAIMVLFLFVIMLLNLRTDTVFAVRWTVPKVLGLAVTIGILSQLVAVFSSPAAQLGPPGDYPLSRTLQEGAVQVIGTQLYTRYVLPFEVISVLLLVAVIGAVLMAKRRPEEEQPAADGGSTPGSQTDGGAGR